MMIDEFLKMAKLPDINSEDYDIIETVYMFHPAIKEKKQIAYLYSQFGMTLIKDLLPRADKARLLEEEIQEKRMQIEALQQAIRDLSE